MQARVALLVFGFVQSFLCSGIVYGWPGLVLILKSDGLYREKCLPGTTAASVAATNHSIVTTVVLADQTDSGGDRGGSSCPEQQTALNALFTIAQGCLTGAMLFNGVLVDKHGPRVASVLGTCLVVCGAVMFGLSDGPDQAGGMDMSVISLCIMAVGGSGVHLSWFHLSNLFPSRRCVAAPNAHARLHALLQVLESSHPRLPRHRQTISSIVIAAFVLSGVVFPIWQLLVVSRELLERSI
jgi:MFS family permease